MDKKVKSFAINSLRRASYRWPGRYMAMKKAHIGRNQYKCAHCPEGTVHPRKGVNLDHVIPVVDPETGYQNLDEYATRLLVEESGFQVLCIACHDKKTAEEDSRRPSKTKAKKSLTKKKRSSKVKE